MPPSDVQVCCPDCGDPWTNRRITADAPHFGQTTCLTCKCEWYRQRADFLGLPLPPNLPLATHNMPPLGQPSQQKAPKSGKQHEPEVYVPMTPPLPPQDKEPQNSKKRKPESEAEARSEHRPSTRNVEARFHQRLLDLEDRMTIKLQAAVEAIKDDLAQQTVEICRVQRAEMQKVIRREVIIGVAQTMQAYLKEELRRSLKGMTLTFEGNDKR